MKWILYVVGVVLILFGGLFAMQGLRYLPSQVMYGKPEWTMIGGGMMIVGAVILFIQMHRKR